MRAPFGERVRRVDDARFLRGITQYVGGMTLPGMLSVAFVRSVDAHARLRSVDVSRARAHPGVHRVLANDEANRLCRPIVAHWPDEPCEQPVMATDTVRFVGEIVAAVVADDAYVAEDALELVDVCAEPLPAVTSAEQALAPGAPSIHPSWPDNVLFRETLGAGDVDAAFAGADTRVAFHCQMNRQSAAPIEARAVLAAYDPQLGEMTIWTSSQMPHMVRTKIAELIDFPEHKLRVIAPDVGGGFGVKGHVFPEEIVMAALAREMGRPLRWVEDRREHLSAAYHGKEETVTAELALDADGALRGMKASFVSDAGAYSNFPWTSPSEVSQAAISCPGPYRLSAARAEACAVFTNKVGTSMIRGVGLPAAVLAIEHALDLAAHRLGMDPAEIRRRNMLKRADFPYETATGYRYDSGSPLESMERALEMIGYGDRRREQAEARERGRYLGIGIGPFIEGTTWGYDYPEAEQWWKNAGVYESAHLRVDPSGGVVLSVGTHSHGQSHATVFSQLVASVLTCDVGDVEFVQGDTARTPYGWGTWGSRSAVAGGGAVIRAAELVRDKILRVAAHLLEVDAAELELADGRVCARGAPGRGMSLREVARAAVYEGRVPDDETPGLEVTYQYKPPSPFSNATHVAWVEVDPECGRVEILRYVVAEDCGRMINPTVVEGQITGGVAQGIGSVLLEEHRYDESGQLVTASLMDYLLPRANDVPTVEIGHLETPSPLSVAGIKGMGEGGAVGPVAAVPNAVSDALLPLCGWQPVTKLPITPESVLQMIRRGRG
jgi:carbon-monoxide dehydrogenase large subunit